MPKLSEQNIERMQPELKAMFGHSTVSNIPTADLATSTHPDEPLVSNGFFFCTGMVLLYHNAQGEVEPTLIHLSTPHLGAPIRNFLNSLNRRMEAEGGHVEAVFITGARSTGSDGNVLDADAVDMRAAVAEIFPEDKITFQETIKHPKANSFGLAYVPPKNTTEGMVCVRDHETDFITPHFPFDTVNCGIGEAEDKGKGGRGS